ncbi:uncharacterized protein THITE_111636 [Thermothielavioides terrestris NRRL 8126]|uniref:Uncharacterized protein n=1 Tax=Thermothielavioides terrestris (strain ATCC 38088 / NRRL 8126) TaxID=578455 RepID=G2R511_THETT|nr:uncharacterized protein THITE_111636 [Thermothielavioides terrestris NRRL 8126]AEO65288.1 hypothetical protein THITE_111636 [Thermothielavioides terrestris NRRL 8126]
MSIQLYLSNIRVKGCYTQMVLSDHLAVNVLSNYKEVLVFISVISFYSKVLRCYIIRVVSSSLRYLCYRLTFNGTCFITAIFVVMIVYIIKVALEIFSTSLIFSVIIIEGLPLPLGEI